MKIPSANAQVNLIKFVVYETDHITNIIIMLCEPNFLNKGSFLMIYCKKIEENHHPIAL